MSYIVSPAWVYWVYVLNALSIVFAVSSGLLGIAVVVFSIFWCANDWDYEDKEDIKSFKNFYFFLIGAFLFSILCTIFIPSKETMITMKVAELATKENILLTSQQLKEIVDYIMEAIKALK